MYITILAATAAGLISGVSLAIIDVIKELASGVQDVLSS